MKKSLLFLVCLASLLTLSNAVAIERLDVNSNNRFLEAESGKPFFPIADTAWQIAWKLDRSEVLTYLQTRKDQKFNTINLVAFPMDGTAANQYGDQPFEIVSGKYDPLQPKTTAGNDPGNSTEYDYWDHLDYIITSAQNKGLYVVMLPAWGSRIAGDWGDGSPNSSVILDTGNAKSYATWIANRYKNFKNIIWMIGGDRSAVYGSYDYRPAFRKMAEGVLAGNTNRPLLMSYHPRKNLPNSSEWFHNDSWLSFNSIQEPPERQITYIAHDFALSPAKPTWLFEGGYEDRTCGSGTYDDWQVRFQAYQTVFSGGFGYTYGHMSIWDFDSDWESRLLDPGAKDMQHLSDLMSSITDSQFFDLRPYQSLIDGDTGSMSGSEGFFSTCIVASRTKIKDLAMVYSANGRNVRVKMDQLADEPMRARWFNPRDGSYTAISTNVTSGSGAPIYEFNPPGSIEDGNDYVLVLDLNPGPDPEYDPITSGLNVGANGRYLVNDNGTPVFLQCDWAVAMPWAATATDISTYLNARASQGFNAIAIQAMDKNYDDATDYATFENKAGYKPFQLQSGGAYDGRWDLTKPVENYWSLIDTIIDTANSKGMYVILGAIPVRGCILAGSAVRCMDRNDVNTAYAYGNWLGNRYADKTNIIWLAGFGRAADEWNDVSTTVDAIAKGIADGVNGVSNNTGVTDYSTTLMSYTSERWADNASTWFNDEDWSDFNTVYDVPGGNGGDQIAKIAADYALTTVKPTFLLGPCWEHQRQSTIYTAPQCRFQMYQSFLAGGVIGVTYGNRYCALFDSVNNWQSELSSTAAGQVKYAKTVLEPLMTSMIPDQDLLSSSTDKGEITQGDSNTSWYYAKSTIIQAARTVNGSNAVIYSAYGNAFIVRMQSLTYADSMKAEWFNPRTGTKTLISNSIQSGAGAPNHEFDPSGSPAQDNDAVLVLTSIIPEPAFIIGGFLFVLALLRRK